MKFRVGDRVSVTCAGGCCVDRKGEVITAHEWIDDAWMVRFDDDGQTFPCGASIMRLDVPTASTTDDDNDDNDDNDEIITIINDAVRARLAYGMTTHGHGVRVDDKLDWEDEALAELFDGLVYTAARLIELHRKRDGESK